MKYFPYGIWSFQITPKAFHLSAQGWREERAPTLGNTKTRPTLKELNPKEHGILYPLALVRRPGIKTANAIAEINASTAP
jgi:hypothetical protein